MSSPISRQNAAYVEELYERYLQDSESVDPSWRHFFQGMEFGRSDSAPGQPAHDRRIFNLTRAYREWGHLAAQLDPLGDNLAEHQRLRVTEFGFSEGDLEKSFPTPRLMGPPRAKLREIQQWLHEIYCGRIGIEYMDFQNPDAQSWFQERIEPNRNRPDLTLENKRAILTNLNHAETFEKFLQSKYVGQKRFSLEGAETLIPAVAELIDQGAELGIEELVVGMAHRGRLNILANVLNKTYETIFAEFEDNFLPGSVAGSGEVKYHKGFSADTTTPSGKKVHITLTANPSHLEVVNPVVEGICRAKQILHGDPDQKHIVPFLIHGDASFAGQGLVAETLNFSQLEGYKTGGTIHLIVNNQIGFTTDPKDGRSTRYASDMAKIVLAPAIHVNGDDPEAVIHAVRLAVEFRQKFHRDIVIDMVCYRRHGHNEGDEPSFTQPLMYEAIRNHPTVRSLYTEELVRRGDVEAELAQELEQQFKKELQEALDSTRQAPVAPHVDTLGGVWSGFRRATPEDFERIVDTSVDAALLRQIAARFTELPATFTPHPKVRQLMQERRRVIDEGQGIDWGTGEALAFGSLLWQGRHVRVSGQDSRRGTFSHRHALVVDTKTGEHYFPLAHLKEGQGLFAIYNSLLSELAVLGFDFGYSMAYPEALVVWEAQFGDFINGAQIIIDQFFSSSEAKWQRMSGLVLLLPHGYEGQGPEHSSARPERFLQLCAEQNMQVANPSTPAQFFHLLRRQVLRDFRKPLVVLTPKSLLRHPLASSGLEDFSSGHFREVIGDDRAVAQPEKVLLCSGKVYYDLLQKRDEQDARDIAIVRLEQYYPFAERQLAVLLESYGQCREVVWVQEEPQNMGAWFFVAPRIEKLLRKNQRLSYVGRRESASPAIGSLHIHQKEQKELVDSALRVGVSRQ
ncbi:MAG: 2-oxoglutarate dehydrogenase E1 component [Acidobacteriota bacterium]